jgi:hypothetical protein
MSHTKNNKAAALTASIKPRALRASIPSKARTEVGRESESEE